jgi:hypothetical protein
MSVTDKLNFNHYLLCNRNDFHIFLSNSQISYSIFFRKR